ncbi:hypothetical protein D3C80_1024040 [compost metagenome]
MIGTAAQTIVTFIHRNITEAGAAQDALSIQTVIAVAVGVADAALIAMIGAVLIDRLRIGLRDRLTGQGIVVVGLLRRLIIVKGIIAGLAVAVRGIENAPLTKANIRTCATHRQFRCAFGAAFQSQPVSDAVTSAAAGHPLAIIGRAHAIIASQGTGGQAEIAHAGLQQVTGDIKRHHGTDLSA